MAVRFGSVRVTWRFGSVRFVLCSVAGREVFDRMGVDEYQIGMLCCSRGIWFLNMFETGGGAECLQHLSKQCPKPRFFDD